ncbi:MAG TPA: N-acetylmuramoyl-L-alanine amidase [Candidatus Acidoferrum sp.]|nr:N-acetylmuramoyl-L-alanine amidase [Candidatus Acidoferrum sp.]
MKHLNSILLAAFVLCGGLPGAYAAKVMGVRSYRAPDYTRLVFDLDSTLQYQIDNKIESHKVVVRLKNSTLATSLDKLNLANTPIANVTTATGSDHDTLVELTVRNKVDPRGFTLGKNEQYGDRLVVDLYDQTSKPEAADDDKSDPIGAISASVTTSGKRDIVVALSAGHGGDDPGAIGVHKLQEKQVTLAISREVADQLNKIPGYKAVLIRDDDYYVPLRQRIKLGHDKKADLYIAIHADAADNKSARGATVYALSERGATSEQARRLAAKENNADLIGGVGPVSLNDKDAVLASVLLDLSMTASVASSLEIGHMMIASLDKMTHLRRSNVEQAAFVELKSADIPSLLVESGYITNAEDASRLDSAAWRRQFAGALVSGITHWFDERPPRGTLIAWEKDHGAPAATYKEHKITRGETLSQIASQYDVSMEAIRTFNQLKSDNIRPGQILKIPAS